MVDSPTIPRLPEECLYYFPIRGNQSWRWPHGDSPFAVLLQAPGRPGGRSASARLLRRLYLR